MKRIAGVILLGLLPFSASAAPGDVFATSGGWTISQFDKKTCVAVNRPGEEFNVAPFNALWVVQGPGVTNVTLEVFFWPGAFKKKQTGELVVSDGHSAALKFEAIAVETHAFRTTDPVRASDIRRLAISPLMHFATKTVRQELVFDVEHLGRTLDYLEACVINL